VVSTATICPSRHTNSLATKTYDILIRVTRVPSCTLTTNNIPTICDESPSFLISIPAPIGPFARSSATHLLACFDHQPASRASLDPQYRRRRSKKKKVKKVLPLLGHGMALHLDRLAFGSSQIFSSFIFGFNISFARITVFSFVCSWRPIL
jgi:hypothetical protein